MRKTMLSVLVIGASVFTASAFAQAHLGGGTRADAGIRAGVAAPGAIHAADQATTQTERTLHRSSSHVKQHARKTVDKTRSDIDDHAGTDADANDTIEAGAGDAHADANADAGEGLDTAANAGKAGEMGRGVGGEVRDDAHAAIQSTDRAAGSIGDAVRGVNASGNAHVSGNAHAHGH